nr:sugar phosphate nucleotidyltransferase [Yersinia rochesterensis]
MNTIPVRSNTCSRNLQVNAFWEKPNDPPTVPGHPDRSLTSMGIYVFNTEFLCEC